MNIKYELDIFGATICRYKFYNNGIYTGYYYSYNALIVPLSVDSDVDLLLNGKSVGKFKFNGGKVTEDITNYISSVLRNKKLSKIRT